MTVHISYLLQLVLLYVQINFSPICVSGMPRPILYLQHTSGAMHEETATPVLVGCGQGMVFWGPAYILVEDITHRSLRVACHNSSSMNSSVKCFSCSVLCNQVCVCDAMQVPTAAWRSKGSCGGVSKRSFVVVSKGFVVSVHSEVWGVREEAIERSCACLCWLWFVSS